MAQAQEMLIGSKNGLSHDKQVTRLWKTMAGTDGLFLVCKAAEKVENGGVPELGWVWRPQTLLPRDKQFA